MFAALLLSHAGAITAPQLMGQTEIKRAPKRVVVLEFGFMDALAKLGVKPVGIAADGDKASTVLPHLQKYYQAGSVALVGNRHAPSLEKILALKPDLIIADENDHKQIYAQLNKIAPRPHQQLLNRAKAISKPAAGRVMVGVPVPTGFFIHSDKSYIGSLLEVLGRNNPAVNKDVQTQYAVSIEGLLALNPDTLIVLYNPEDEAIYRKFAAGSIVKGLNDSKAGRLYTFNHDAWAKGRGVIGLEGILNDIVKSRVLSGEPKK